jgi:hypothetical protein
MLAQKLRQLTSCVSSHFCGCLHSLVELKQTATNCEDLRSVSFAAAMPPAAAPWLPAECRTHIAQYHLLCPPNVTHHSTRVQHARHISPAVLPPAAPWLPASLPYSTCTVPLVASTISHTSQHVFLNLPGISDLLPCHPLLCHGCLRCAALLLALTLCALQRRPYTMHSWRT